MDPGKQILLLQRAIVYQCIECQGFEPDDVEGCTMKACSLWPFRNGDGPRDEDAGKYRMSPRAWAQARNRDHPCGIEP